MNLDYPSILRFVMFLSIFLLMLSFESFWPKRIWETPRVKRLFIHVLISFLNTLLTRFAVFTPLFFWLHFVRENGWGLSSFLGLQGTHEIIVTLVLFDCLEYWWHRFNHRIPFLWRFHRAHHIDTHLDVTTSLRFHPGELLLSGIVKFFWILFWGPSLWGFVIYGTALVAFAQFHHSNIDLPKKIERIVRLIHITPRLHTSHHTVTLRTRDANYCIIFSIWDRLFKSFQEPDAEEMKLLGLDRGRSNYLSMWTFFKSPFIDYEKID